MNAKLRTELVQAAIRSALAIEGKARGFMGPWVRRSPDKRLMFSVFEHVVVYELARAFTPALRQHSVEFEWEMPYARSYRYAHADFAILSQGAAHESESWWQNRSVVEVKWLLSTGALYNLAQDALKLAWAEAAKRYVLAIGVYDGTARGLRRLGSKLEVECREGRFDWPSADLRAARRNLIETRVSAVDRKGDLTAVLFEVCHRGTLSAW